MADKVMVVPEDMVEALKAIVANWSGQAGTGPDEKTSPQLELDFSSIGDLDWAVGRDPGPEPVTQPTLPRCTHCHVELSPTLDAYYGHDQRAATHCVKCRKALGFR